MPDSCTLAVHSLTQYVRLIWAGRLKRRRQRVGCQYHVEGGMYTIFRETEKLGQTGEPVLLIIGFRLKIIRSNRLLHWLFQRVCILTTPFWSGLPGFKTKLWLVDQTTKNYMGIYDWRGKLAAQQYIRFLVPILSFSSLRGSVWVKSVYGNELDAYLAAHNYKKRVN